MSVRQQAPAGRTWSNNAARGSRVVRRGAARSRSGGRGASFAIVFALYLLISTGIATAGASVLHGRSDPPGIGADPPPRADVATVVQPPKYLVLIVLDGARPDYFGMTHLPHVDALRARGTQFTNAIDGILEAETPSGHATLATGSSPARDGLLGFNWAQNDNDFSLFSPDIVRAGAMEHIMESANVPTIAGLYKERFRTAKVVALSGHKYYAADPLGGPAADAIMYYTGDPQGRYVPVAIPGHVPSAGVLDAPGLVYPTTHLALGVEDRLATKLALAAFRKMHQRLTLINYPEFDWPLGHVYGGSESPHKVIKLMKEFDHDLGMIEDTYRKAGILNKTLFVITADHGMMPITRYIPETLITNAVAQAGTTAPVATFNTGSYVWLTDATKAHLVASIIDRSGDPGIQSTYYLQMAGGKPHYVLAHGSLVSKDAAAANRHLLSTLLNGHEPNVVVLLREHQSSTSPTTGWKADHGGASWESQHIPLIFSGPGVRAGLTTQEPAQLEDVAPTLLSVMGVNPKGMQGRILTDVLVRPNADQLNARLAEINRLSPLVKGLSDQSNTELRQ